MPEKPGSDQRSSGLESCQRSCYSPKIHRTLTPDKPRFTRLQKQSYHNKTQVNKSACLNQTFVTGKKKKLNKAATSTALPFTPLLGAAPCPAASRALPEQRALSRGQVRTLLLFPSWLSVYVSNRTCCAKNKRLWHDFFFFLSLVYKQQSASGQKAEVWLLGKATAPWHGFNSIFQQHKTKKSTNPSPLWFSHK